jgi:hypothetical protein
MSDERRNGVSGTLASPLPAMTTVMALGGTLAICAAYWVLGAPRFADYAEYVGVTQQLVNDPTAWPVIGPEGLSRGMLRAAASTAGDVPTGVQQVALLIQGVTLLALLWVARRREVLATNLLVSVALFAPLLALITLRATPAYLLCAAAIVAARMAERPRHLLVISAGILALAFHASAAYVVAGAVGAVVLPRRVSRKTLFVAGLAAGLVGLLVRRTIDVTAIGSLLQGAVGPAGTLLADRLVYLAGAGDPVGVLHIVYFLFVSTLMYRFVLRQPPHPSDRLVLVLFALYGALTVSPVVAVRSSHFVVLPLLLTAPAPVVDTGDAVLSQTALIAGCLGLLAFSFLGVLVKP